MYISLSAIYFLLQKYKKHRTYVDLPGNAVPMNVIDKILAVFDVVQQNSQQDSKQIPGKVGEFVPAGCEYKDLGKDEDYKMCTQTLKGT